MAVDIKPLAAASGVDDLVKQMVLAVPDFTVGDTLHGALVNALEGATPGNYSQMFGTGPSFQSVFFPTWSAGPYHSVAASASGFSDWSSFNIAVMCQAMYDLTSDTLHQQLDPDSIGNAVNSFNGKLNSNLAGAYSAVFASSWSDFATPFRQVTDKPTALAQYQQVLLSQVNVHEIWYASGAWKHPEWEMYHHYVKLLALGATVAEVDMLIGQLQQAGLTIEPTVVAGVWTGFTGFLLNNPNVTGADIANDARTPILADTYPPSFGGGPSMPMPEGNSYEFTANGQPGSPYRTRSVSSSCFASDTRVRMADGSLRPIDQIKTGDLVTTPDGPRPVAVLSTPLLAGRDLHRISGESFSFTGSHPFVASGGTNEPALAAVDPHHLIHAIPTLSHRGVAALTTGTRLAGLEPAASTESALKVAGVASTGPTSEEQHVFDLVVEPRPGESGDYYVAGATGRCFRVRPEIPIFTDSPYAAVALLTAALSSAPAFVDFVAGVDSRDLHAALQRLGDRVGATLVGVALAEVDPASAFPDKPEQWSVDNFVAERLPLFSTGDRALDAATSAYFDMLLARAGAELDLVCALPWRHIGTERGDVLSVTIRTLHFARADEMATGPGWLVVTARPELGTGPAVETGPGSRTWSHAHTYDEVLHFDPGTADTEAIGIHLIGPDRVLRASARAEMPDPRAAYRRMRPVLRRSNGSAAGHLVIDVRRMTDAAVAAELAEAADVPSGSRLGHAEALGRAMGRRLAATLAGMPRSAVTGLG